jgi:DivIVA domain-containing protein
VRPEFTPDDVEQTTFTVAFRGYDKEEVDVFLAQLAEHLRYVGEDTHSDYQNLGAEMGELLQHARNSAESMLSDAKQGADELRRKSAEEADRLRAEATEYAKRVREDADDDARWTRSRAEEEARSIVEGAEQRIRLLVEEDVEARAKMQTLRKQLDQLSTRLEGLEHSDLQKPLRAAVGELSGLPPKQEVRELEERTTKEPPKQDRTKREPPKKERTKREPPKKEPVPVTPPVSRGPDMLGMTYQAPDSDDDANRKARDRDARRGGFGQFEVPPQVGVDDDLSGESPQTPASVGEVEYLDRRSGETPPVDLEGDQVEGRRAVMGPVPDLDSSEDDETEDPTMDAPGRRNTGEVKRDESGVIHFDTVGGKRSDRGARGRSQRYPT